MRSQDHRRLRPALSRMRRGPFAWIACAAVAATALALAAAATAAEPIATLRAAAIDQEPDAPAMMRQSNKDLRRARNYPEQPPTIPHKIRGYQINLKTNKCMSCHSRMAVEQSQAPMVSITHFMDRDGQVLASVTSRRYFCTQCHVPQLEVRPLIENTFVDVDTLLKKGN